MSVVLPRRIAALALAVALGVGGTPRAQMPSDIDRDWRMGDRLAALDRGLLALENDPQDVELRATLVEWEVQVHRYRSAREHLAGLGPEHDPLRGQVLYLLGDYENALRFLDGSDPEHTLARVDALEVLQRDEEARAALDEAAEVLGQDDPRVLSWRGRMLAREGRHEDAIAAFRIALEGDALDQQARYGLGRALVTIGEREAGLEVLGEHRRLAPLIDRYEFALQSLDLAPTNAGNHAELGDVERLLGRVQRARVAYGNAARLAQPAEIAPIALRAARLEFEDARNPRAAVEKLDRALERVEDVRLRVRAGDYLLESGDAAGAVKRFEAALASRPNDAAIRQRLDRARDAARSDR